jgi:diaminopimelate decarboxylase
VRHFDYDGDLMCAESVDLAALAEKVGTPFYCYSAATMRRHMRVFRAAVGGDALIAYSAKANSNLAVLKLLASEGAGADVVSGGELMRALEAGIAPSKIVFSGVGKTRDEMAAAMAAGILQFNVESANELDVLNAIARDKGVRAPIAFRVNPDVSAGGHAKISTGKAEDKFGVAWRDAPALYARAAGLSNISVEGVDVHIGSQIADLQPFAQMAERVGGLIRDLRANGADIRRLDVGGGLGVPYGDGPEPPHPEDYAAVIRRVAAPLGVDLVFEPGRMIVANAGALIARILYVKRGAERRFLIVDAGMNDLIRPALYDAFHEILPVRRRSGGAAPYDVVGPVCETGDLFARQRMMPPVEEGDFVAFMTAGAYGAAQSSQYNSRPLIPEVMVDGADWRIIRRRPTFSEMTALERMPDQ